MDSRHLDRLASVLASRLTRRSGLGLFAAVGLGALIPHDEDVEAKKRRKKRQKKKNKQRGQGGTPSQNPEPAPEQCRELDIACLAGATTCCAGLRCDRTVVAGEVGNFCCKPEGATCTDAEGCCSGTCDFLVAAGTCAPCRGRTCSATQPCCGGLTCTNGYCDGCRDRAVSCSSSSQCCFSDCVSGACLSAAGGRCARDVDCRACYLGGTCAGACVGGACTV